MYCRPRPGYISKEQERNKSSLSAKCRTPRCHNLSFVRRVPQQQKSEGVRMIKLVVMIKRKPGMSKEAFHRYWNGPHGDQVLGCADFKRHIRRYVQSHVVTQEGIKLPWGVSDYDGQAELWFDSVDAMNTAFNEPSFLATVHPDDATFIDMAGCQLMVVEEIPKVG